ncbi:hypothetical protein C8R43DRAFT_1179106 [Mycena crocata]|nr:hypothetical protein C8R43DRAFT_1179106 [Mycena crocata]
MFSKTLLTFIFASLATVKAVNVCAYSNTLGCSGSAVCCSNLAEHLCCVNVPTGFGFAVQYQNLPGPVSDGQAWTSNNCVNGGVFTDQIGTGTKCYVGGGTKINSMAWTNTASRIAGVSGTTNPNAFMYTEDGVEKYVQIPAEDGAIEAMLGFYKAKNFTALEAYGPVN